MPSLRRSFSTSVARSTPYPSSSLVGSVRAGYPRRPSSASETSSRRVLADIDWWRVTEGQCDPALVEAQPQEEQEETDEDADILTPQLAVADAQPLLAPAPGDVFGGDAVDELDMATSSFSQASGILLEPPTTPVSDAASPQLPFRAPRSRALRVPFRRHASESSVSSVESSPDLPLTPRESLSFFDPGFVKPDAEDDELLAGLPAFLRALPHLDFTDAKKGTQASPRIFTNDLIFHEDLFA